MSADAEVKQFGPESIKEPSGNPGSPIVYEPQEISPGITEPIRTQERKAKERKKH